MNAVPGDQGWVGPMWTKIACEVSDNFVGVSCGWIATGLSHFVSSLGVVTALRTDGHVVGVWSLRR